MWVAASRLRLGSIWEVAREGRAVGKMGLCITQRQTGGFEPWLVWSFLPAQVASRGEVVAGFRREEKRTVNRAPIKGGKCNLPYNIQRT